ncbi:MAG: alpha/beta fold hydrolase [Ignavibacteria bacterium]|nr:alpha/beta fold hydrolase [Bacteroidota bacterium]MSQ46542.1 alpha/beta fold hydrolase [Ignavibacteria bacterium]
MWFPQIDYFSNNYRVIALDLRGFGKSPKTEQHLSIDLFVGDLLAQIENLKIDKVTLVGLSMGGYVAQRFYQFYPELVKRLILCNTRPQKDSADGKKLRFEVIEFIKNGNYNSFVENFIKKSVAQNNLERIYPVLLEIIQKNKEENVCDALLCLANRPDTTEVLPTINIPTLVIAGQNDELISVDILREMSNSIRNSEFVIFKNVGHFSNLENSKLFNDTVERFLHKTV